MSIERVLASVDKFIETYYNIYDENRHFVESLYRHNAVIVWNGHVYQGSKVYSTFLSQLPSTKHDIKTVDAQPLIQTNQIIVTVCGSVQFASSCPKAISQQFVLAEQEKEQGKFYIISDSLRFV